MLVIVIVLDSSVTDVWLTAKTGAPRAAAATSSLGRSAGSTWGV